MENASQVLQLQQIVGYLVDSFSSQTNMVVGSVGSLVGFMYFSIHHIVIVVDIHGDRKENLKFVIRYYDGFFGYSQANALQIEGFLLWWVRKSCLDIPAENVKFE